MESYDTQQDRWKLMYKAALVLLCCPSGAWCTAWINHLCKSNVESSTPLPLSLFTAALFVGLLSASLWLGTKRRQSASWAVLAYGSWMAIPCVVLCATLYMAYDTHALWDNWLWYLIGVSLVACFIYGGIRAALRDQWIPMFYWWLGSFIIPLYVFLVIFSQISD